MAELARHGAEFGVVASGMTINMEGVRARKRHMVDGEIRLHLELYKASGAELIMGEAHFIAPKTVEVRLNDGGARVVAGDHVFSMWGPMQPFPMCQAWTSSPYQVSIFGGPQSFTQSAMPALE